ncbi:MAG: site-2 protease family protein [Caulobacteraceae bacterium]
MDLLTRFLYNLNAFFKITPLLYSFPGIIVALTFHEYAHAFIAYRMGDNTAKMYGRLTLNPIAHLDPLGFLCLIVTRSFGWAKPVPVNDMNFRNRKSGLLLVSLAGPLANFLLAFLIALIYRLVFYKAGNVILGMLQYAYFINLGLGVFNLIPIPPLDGSKILDSFLTNRQRFMLRRYEVYSNIIILLLVFSGFISIILNPLISFLNFIINSIVSLII